jgi:hypothetical protein
MAEFSAIFCSTALVTSCSTRVALMPGQGVTAVAIRTGMVGSLRFGI